jgi:hypothetical protein
MGIDKGYGFHDNPTGYDSNDYNRSIEQRQEKLGSKLDKLKNLKTRKTELLATSGKSTQTLPQKVGNFFKTLFGTFELYFIEKSIKSVLGDIQALRKQHIQWNGEAKINEHDKMEGKLMYEYGQGDIKGEGTDF